MANPRDPLVDPADAALERRLAELGREIAYPATPDLAAAVRARLAHEPAPAAAPGSPPRRARWAWLAVAALLLIALVLTLFPDARTAIADRLGLRGVRIWWVEEAPTPPPSPAGASLQIGRAVTLDQAQAALGVPLLVPTLPGFTAPDAIYLLGLGENAMVSFVYGSRPGLPASGVLGVGALLTQFQGSTERNLIEKPLLRDDGSLGTELVGVTVAGQPGFWISGAPHASFLVCHDDHECREERYRLAGNVLLWEADGLTLRLESALSQDATVAIAASVQPLP